MRWLAVGLLVLAMGFAVFEQSSEDVQNKLTHPTKGQLYERDPLAPP